MDRVNTALRRIPVWAVYLAGVIPAVWLVVGGLGVDPVKTLEHGLGLWGLRFLIASLAVTPLMRVGLRLIKFRRALGMLGFWYILAHFAVWIGLDMGLWWNQIAQDLVKRPYILIGFAGFLCLIPLAVTSTNAMVRRLGPRWKLIHRLAYPAIFLGALHFGMVGKVWTAETVIHLAVVVGLLALRLVPKRVVRLRTA